MGSSLKALVIAGEYPYPPQDGHSLRNYNILANLSQGVTVDLVVIANSALSECSTQAIRRLGGSCRDIKIVPSDTLQSLRLTPWGKIVNLFFPHEFSMGGSFSDAVALQVRALLAKSKYDVVFCCGLYPFLSVRREIGSLPCLVDIVDSLSLWQRSRLPYEQHLGRRIRKCVEYLWAKRYESMHCSKAKNITLVSPLDRTYIARACPNSRVWVVPNGVDFEYFRPARVRAQSTMSILFTGVMDYPPNEEAAIFFIDEILPLIKKHLPQVSFFIVGKNPQERLKATAGKDPCIQVSGFVKDIRPYFDEADVYVAPMISGAGLKNKILEAWAMSVPVVATSASCIGLEAKDGSNLLIADTPQAFAGKVIDLLKNRSLAVALAGNARRTVETRYSWRNVSARFEQLFTEIISSATSECVARGDCSQVEPL